MNARHTCFKRLSVFCSMAILSLSGFGKFALAADSGEPVTDTTELAKADIDLAAKIHAINQMEIEAGKMAKARGSSWHVRALGNRIERDHALADKRLLEFASSFDEMNKPVADDTSKMHAVKMQELAQKSGADFDMAFVAMMQEGHAKAIALLASARVSTIDTKIQHWIDTNLPILRQHHDVSTNIQSKQST